MLTFESNKNDGLLEIHGDREGLLKLARHLNKLAEKDSADHIHLMTDDWGGSGLSNETQGENSSIYHHVKIYLWPK